MRILRVTDDITTVLATAGQSGLRRVEPTDLPRLLGAARGLGYPVVALDLALLDKAGVLAAISSALSFPRSFGHNWDALADSLGDLSWWTAPGLVVVIEHAAAWRAHDPDGLAILLDVVEDAADGHAARGLPCWMIVAEAHAAPETATGDEMYELVARIAAHASGRSLEHYLAALWQLARAHREEAALSIPVFLALLADALVAPVPLDDPARMERTAAPPEVEAWESQILRQIVDLRELAAAGALADPQRGFGLDAPRGSRWYNFDPATFLECAAAGTFGLEESEAIEPITWHRFAAFLGAGQCYE